MFLAELNFLRLTPLFTTPISGDTVGSLPTRNGFDSRYWSVPFNLTNSPIVTIYLYLLVFAIFFVFYQDTARNQQLSTLADLHNRSADRFRKIAFLLTLLTLLGTPVTFGFSYKLVVLSNLSSSAWTLIAAVAINLIMLVFYLQAARYPQLTRKKRAVFAHQDAETASKGALVLGCGLTVFAIIVAPAVIDILSTLMI